MLSIRIALQHVAAVGAAVFTQFNQCTQSTACCIVVPVSRFLLHVI